MYKIKIARVEKGGGRVNFFRNIGKSYFTNRQRKSPARYDYDSIDIHDGSWLSPIEFFYETTSSSSLRAISGPEGEQSKNVRREGRAAHAC